jgi:hypothetical protein
MRAFAQGILPAGRSSPFDFGFVPSTLGDHGDPLPRAHGQRRIHRVSRAVQLIGAIAVEQTEDGKTEDNDRLLAVAAKSVTHRSLDDLHDVNDDLLRTNSRLRRNRTTPRASISSHRDPVVMAARLPDRRAAIDALLKIAQSENGSEVWSAIAAIGRVAKGSHDGQLAERLMVWQASHARAITFALLSIGGPDARHRVLELLPQLTPEPRAEAIWALEGWTLEHLLGHCRNFGLISPVAGVFDADSARCRYGSGEDRAFSLLNPLVDLLAEEGAAVHFQAEHRQYSPRYDRLIRRFMRCTQPWLRLSALTDVVDYADGTAVGLTVQFVARGRRYRLEMFHHSKRYYPRYIVPMLNTVVRESGHDEEFVAIEDADQRLSYLFGPIEVIHRVCRDSCSFRSCMSGKLPTRQSKRTGRRAYDSSRSVSRRAFTAFDVAEVSRRCSGHSASRVSGAEKRRPTRKASSHSAFQQWQACRVIRQGHRCRSASNSRGPGKGRNDVDDATVAPPAGKNEQGPTATLAFPASMAIWNLQVTDSKGDPRDRIPLSANIASLSTL